MPEHLKILDVPNKDLIDSKLSVLNPNAFQLPDKPFEVKEFEKEIVRKALTNSKVTKAKPANISVLLSVH